MGGGKEWSGNEEEKEGREWRRKKNGEHKQLPKRSLPLSIF
jgi:hypothetical protein